MRCGKCKAQPTTITHVQRCYGIVPESTTEARQQYETTPAPNHRGDDDITPKQRKYIQDLLVKKAVDENDLSDELGYTILDCYKDEAREVISYLLTLPDKAKPEPQAPTLKVPVPEVPAGRYALLESDPNHPAVPDVWKFYQVDKPKQGRWKGRTFLSVLASDEKHAVRGADLRSAVLARLALDPTKASRDFGRQSGRCGVCGRLLTDADTIQRGIGPRCEANLS